MESVLNKGVWLGVLTGVQPADSNEERVLAGTIVALIEIREAIEERLGVLATGQLVIAKEIAETITNHLSPEINGQNAGIMQIAEAIHENTAVQGEIVARAGTIEQQGVEMLEGFDEVRGDLESMRSAMEAQRRVMSELVKTVGDQADRPHRHEKWLTAQKGIANGSPRTSRTRPERWRRGRFCPTPADRSCRRPKTPDRT